MDRNAAGGLLRGRQLSLRTATPQGWAPGTLSRILVATIVTVLAAGVVGVGAYVPPGGEGWYFGLSGGSMLVLAVVLGAGSTWYASTPRPSATPTTDPSEPPTGTFGTQQPGTTTDDDETTDTDTDTDTESESDPEHVRQVPSDRTPLLDSHWTLTRTRRNRTSSTALARAGTVTHLVAALILLALAAYGTDYAARRAAHHGGRPTSALAHTLLPGAPAFAQALRCLSGGTSVGSVALGAQTVTTLVVLGLGTTLLVLPPSQSRSFPPWPAGTGRSDALAVVLALSLSGVLVGLRVRRSLAVPLLLLYVVYVVVSLAP